MKAYQLTNFDAHDLFFHTHVQFSECLPDPSSSSPSSVLPNSYDTSFEIFYEEVILEVVASSIAIDPRAPP